LTIGLRRRKINSTYFDQFGDLFITETLAEVSDQVFLTMLAEDHAIQHQGTLKVDLLHDLSAVRQPGDVSFDLGVAVWGDPKWIKIILSIRP
jgi:hypothetical protein